MDRTSHAAKNIFMPIAEQVGTAACDTGSKRYRMDWNLA